MRRLTLYGSAFMVVGLALFGAGQPAVQAQATPEGFHLCPTACVEPFPSSDPTLGVIVVGDRLPTFGLRRSLSSGTFPNLTLAIFVPSQEPSLGSFTVNFGAAAAAAVVVGGRPWTSGCLTHRLNDGCGNSSYLGLLQTGGPANPISAFLGASSAIVPGTTEYDVYLANLGPVSSETSATFSFSGISGFPLGTVFYAFATSNTDFDCSDDGICATVWDTTVPSSSIIVITPEPGTMLLLGTGLLGFGVLLRRRIA